MQSERITDLLAEHNIDLLTFETIDSTNAAAKRLVEAGAIKRTTALIANEQTAGYGRYGRKFHSPHAKGLYLTVVKEIDIQTVNAGLITTGIATMIAEGLSEQLKIEVGIKWVNDLYYQHRKVAGILVEQQADFLIIGIGINLLADRYPAELRRKVGSLFRTESFDFEQLTSALILKTIKYFSLDPVDVLERYRSRSLVIGAQVELLVDRTVLQGVVLAINDQGGLVVDLNHQVRTFYSGEITKLFMTDWVVS